MANLNVNYLRRVAAHATKAMKGRDYPTAERHLQTLERALGGPVRGDTDKPPEEGESDGN